MTNFDYIIHSDIRISLESDYSEMLLCCSSGAWKCAHVIAGSIVEALLVDYLVSTPNTSRPAKDPLKYDLAEAIERCRLEGVLTDRTADLCSVIRSYRNLIHSGRSVRLDESSPNKTTSDITKGLVDLIVDEVGKKRRKEAGLTAEQILSKLQRDADSISIIKHLLSEVSEHQYIRLLTDVLPTAYLSNTTQSDPFDDLPNRIIKTFQITLDAAQDHVKVKVAQEFVRILKEEDGDKVAKYRSAFFNAKEIKYLSTKDRELVKVHLLEIVQPNHTLESIKSLVGLSSFLFPEDCIKWTDPFIRTLFSKQTNSYLKNECRKVFFSEAVNCPDSFMSSFLSRLNDWKTHYHKQKAPEHSDALQLLQSEIIDMRIPF